MLDQAERIEEDMVCDTCKNKEFLMQMRQDLQNNNIRVDSLQQSYSELKAKSDVTAEQTKVSFKLINEIKADIKMYNGDLKMEINKNNDNLRKEFGQQHELLKSEMNNNNISLKNDINSISNTLNNQFMNVTNSMQIMNNTLIKVTEKIDKQEKKPAETWDKLKWLFVGGVVMLVFFIVQEGIKLLMHKTP